MFFELFWVQRKAEVQFYLLVVAKMLYAIFPSCNLKISVTQYIENDC